MPGARSEDLRSQIVTANKMTRFRPYVYTEMGIGMLSGILKNDTAIQISIGIMKAFVEMRRTIAANKFVFEQIIDIKSKLLFHENKLLEHGERIEDILSLLSEPETSKQWLFFNGQFFDAFKLVIDIIRQAKTSVLIIDNYIDNSVLEILEHKKADVTISIITAYPDKYQSSTLISLPLNMAI